METSAGALPPPSCISTSTIASRQPTFCSTGGASTNSCRPIGLPRTRTRPRRSTRRSLRGIWRGKPKIVFSTTLQHVEWNSRLVTGNIADEVNRLKEQPGGEMTIGGAGLASSFMQLDLIDEYWLYVYPLLLGRGKPMFGPLQHKIGLQLLETHMLGHGVILLKYARSGAEPIN